MTGKGTFIAIIAAVLLVGACIFFTAVPAGRAVWNTYDRTLKKVDDASTYEKQKKVEDTARAMIASYEADVLTFEQYKDSEGHEKQGWAEQAKMRANKTASTYNNYILENSFIWAGNVPYDIRQQLPILK